MEAMEADAPPLMGNPAELPRELTRTPETWLLGLRHWIDPLDADREAALKRMCALDQVIEQSLQAEADFAREQHRAPVRVVAKLRERVDSTVKPRRAALSKVYGDGLKLREGRFINLVPIGDAGWDYFMHQWLHGLGVDEPCDIAWCWTCGFVWRPRYSHASKCDRCHHHPPPAALAPEPTAEGGFTHCLPSAKGWELVRHTPCEKCGVPFRAKRSDARRCPDRKQCRRQAAIRRENFELGFLQAEDMTPVMQGVDLGVDPDTGNVLPTYWIEQKKTPH